MCRGVGQNSSAHLKKGKVQCSMKGPGAKTGKGESKEEGFSVELSKDKRSWLALCSPGDRARSDAGSHRESDFSE